MTGQIPRPFSSIALVAAFLMAGVDIIVQANPTRADDCLAAPNSPTRPGSHWYYRLDRASQRKCWYVRALGSPAQQATASAIVGPATVRRSLPALPGPTPLADGVSSADTTLPSPHPRMSAVKPIPAPLTRAIVDDAVRQSVKEENTASNAEVPAPQVSTSSKTSAQADTPPAVAWPDAPTAVAAVKQQPVAMPTDARVYSASYAAENTARGGEPTKSAAMPMIIFPLVALGLAVVGIGSRIVVKIAAGPCSRNDPEFDLSTISASVSGATIGTPTDPSLKALSSIHLSLL